MVRIGRLLAALLVGSLVLGGAGAALLSSEPASAQQGVSVPVMKIGDRYEYSWAYLPPQDPEAPVPDEERWVEGGIVRVTVEGTGVVLDHQGTPTPYVTLVRELVGYESPPSVERVSLVDRLTVQSVHAIDLGEGGPRYQNVAYTRHVPSAVPGLDFQGTTLTPGVSVQAPSFIQTYRVASDHTGGGGGGWMWMDLKLLTYNPARDFSGALPYLQPADPVWAPATVEAAGAIDGLPAVKTSWSYVQSHGARIFEYPGLSGRPGFTEATTVDASWTNAQAVPAEYTVFVSTRFDDLSTMDEAWRYTLASMEAGTTSVSWDAAPADRPTFLLENSGAFHPSDGAAGALPYPLSQALQDVDRFRTDPAWAMWRIQNPNAALMSAEFMPGATSWTGEPTWQWRLHFADHFDAFEVRTERHPAVAVPIIEAMGERDMAYIQPWGDTPPLLTIADGVDLWRETFGAAEDEVPTFVHWGLWPSEWWSPGHCVTGIYSSTTVVADPRLLLRTLSVGHGPAGPCYVFEESTYSNQLQVALDVPALVAHREQWDPAPQS